MSRGSSGSKSAGHRFRTRIMLPVWTVLMLVTLMAGLCVYTVISLPQSASQPGQPAAITATKYDQAIDTIVTLLIEARTIENQFIQQQTPASAIQFEEVTKNMLAQALNLEKDAKQNSDPATAKAAADIIQLASQYHTSFRDLIQAWEIKGITADTGLKQKLHQAGQNIIPSSGSGRTTQALENGLMQLGRAEQDYFAAHTIEAQRLLISAAKTLTRVAGESGLTAAETQAFNKSIKAYTTAFDRYQAVSLATGDKALAATFAAEQKKQEEAMHKASLELESLISTLNTSLAGGIVQVLRQQEQDYLQQGDPGSVEKINKTLAEYNSSLDQETASVPQEQKNAMKMTMAEYQAAFTALVEHDKKIEELAAKGDKSFAALKTLVKTINKKTPPSAPAPFSASLMSPQLSLIIITGTWLAIVLFTLFMARMLASAITIPILRMTDIARRMAIKGDFSQNFPPAKDELGGLATALNALVRQQATNIDVRDTPTVDQLTSDATTLRDSTGKLTAHDLAVREAVAGCEQTVTAAVESVQGLTQSLHQVATIINATTDMAEQTSLMALNAAIKAARSNTHGKEFSVITEELDLLAKRSAEAAKEITLLMNNIKSRMAAGEKLGNESRQALQLLKATTSSGPRIIEGYNELSLLEAASDGVSATDKQQEEEQSVA